MDFRNLNYLNTQLNLISGNLLPMTADGSHMLSIFWRIYHVAAIFFEIGQIGPLIPGLFVQPRDKALKNGTVAVSITMEVIVTLICLRPQFNRIKRLIRKLDETLREADETMREILMGILNPIVTPFKIYGISSVICVILWTAQPITLVFSKNNFTYLDYNFPAVFTTEPMSSSSFILTIITMTIGSVFRFLRKLSLDVYMIHFVSLLTARYRYIAIKLTMLFRDPQNNSDKSGEIPHPRTDKSEKEFRALCIHHNTTIHISYALKEILSTNCSMLYLSSVLRFCFLGIMLSTVPSLPLLEGICIILFALSALIHFFFLCSSVQTLVDASTEVTDNAFNENWYQFRPLIQRSFLYLIMANNNLECKIAAIVRFNLSLTSFITIMNHAYSIALLFLRVN